MAEFKKFAKIQNGIKVLNKEDILECINDNILDKEVLYEFVNKLEVNIVDSLKAGLPTGVPYLCNIRFSEYSKFRKTPERQELIEKARENLDHDKYILFRKELNAEDTKRVKFQKVYNYFITRVIRKNKQEYSLLKLQYGEAYARLKLYALHSVTVPYKYYDYLYDE